MEIKITSNGDITHLEVDGKEIDKVTVINFIGAVNCGVECIYEQIATDEWGHVMLNETRDEVKRELHRIDFSRGEIV